MLRSVRIRDFALIHSLEVELGTGLNLLTGETGSGKSIVVDALGLLVGRRSSPEMVRSGCTSAIVEGCFGFDLSGPIPGILEHSGIPREDDLLLVRREITAGGKSRVFINDSLTTLALLRTIGDNLADIHSQQDQQSLLESPAQLDWLDRFGKNSALVAPVRDSYRKLAGIARRLDELRMDEQERLRRIDVLEFQINELRSAQLLPNEREDLESERKILTNREKLFALSSEGYAILHEHESSLLIQARRLERIVQELSSYDSTWLAYYEPLTDSFFKLEDLAAAMRDYTSHLDFSPERLNQIEERLSDLAKLGRKYGDSFESMTTYMEKCEQQLEQLMSHTSASKELAAQFEREAENYLSLAQQVSDKRKSDAALLALQIRREFEALAMEKMELQVRISARLQQRVSTGMPAHYGPDGLDHVEFFITPNKGEEMKPLTKIASGGELSRIVLAIKSLCGGGEPGRTLVFDEVDVGIGGRVAEAVGKRLRKLAEENQVLCVTHLPQIAAFAEHHYYVSKEVIGSRTETGVKPLDQDGRAEELARMLGGQTITEITRRHAREMLNQSADLSRKPNRSRVN